VRSGRPSGRDRSWWSTMSRWLGVMRAEMQAQTQPAFQLAMLRCSLLCLHYNTKLSGRSMPRIAGCTAIAKAFRSRCNSLPRGSDDGKAGDRCRLSSKPGFSRSSRDNATALMLDGVSMVVGMAQPVCHGPIHGSGSDWGPHRGRFPLFLVRIRGIDNRQRSGYNGGRPRTGPASPERGFQSRTHGSQAFERVSPARCRCQPISLVRKELETDP
jgi:hypothetical protein